MSSYSLHIADLHHTHFELTQFCFLDGFMVAWYLQYSIVRIFINFRSVIIINCPRIARICIMFFLFLLVIHLRVLCKNLVYIIILHNFFLCAELTVIIISVMFNHACKGHNNTSGVKEVFKSGKFYDYFGKITPK